MSISKEKISYVLKCLIVFCSLGGVALSLIQARFDGFIPWGTRLLYFTAQSNLWIGFTCLALLFLPFMKVNERHERRLYLLKYIFTVSITTTGLIFCGLLGPFADKTMHPWSASSFLTHVFSPLFSIIDFFLNPYPLVLKKHEKLSPLLPPTVYVVVTGILNLRNVNFGRGDPYPYFFMHLRSPVGLFGFGRVFPFYMGSFYWIVIFALLTLSISLLYAKRYDVKRHPERA